MIYENWPKRNWTGIPCSASYACPVQAFPSIASQHRHNRKHANYEGIWFGEFSEIIDNAWRKPALKRTVFKKLAKTLVQGDTLYVQHPRIIINAVKDYKPILEVQFNIVCCWGNCSIINNKPSENLEIWIDGLKGNNKVYKKLKKPPYGAVNTPTSMKWDRELRNAMDKIVKLRDEQNLTFRQIAKIINHPRIKCHKSAKYAYLHEKAYRILNVTTPQEFEPKLMPPEHVLSKAKTPKKPTASTLKYLAF